MNARTYIEATCQIGQSKPCGKPATYLIAVVQIADTGWGAAKGREGGVVPLCDFHATTPVSGWDA